MKGVGTNPFLPFFYSQILYEIIESAEHQNSRDSTVSFNIFPFSSTVPPVVSTNTSVVAKQNDRVVLRCRTTDGLPYPTVKIVRRLENGTVIEAKDQFTIASVSPADGGLYSCIGENGAGVAVVNITLTVLGDLTISNFLTFHSQNLCDIIVCFIKTF